MSKKVGGAPGGVVTHTTIPSPKGSVFPHHRLPASGPIIPGSSILDAQFTQAIGITGFPLIAIPFPATQADQLTAVLPSNTDILPPIGELLHITFLDARVGDFLAIWYSFGFAPTPEEAQTAIQTALSIDGPAPVGNQVIAPPNIIQGGAIQSTLTSDTGEAFQGSCLFMFPVVVPGDYTFRPLAYVSDQGEGASMFPPQGQVSLMGFRLGLP